MHFLIAMWLQIPQCKWAFAFFPRNFVETLTVYSPQVLQKNMGLFSLRSQLAQEGNSSEEDSTRKRSSESVGGTEWPSRSEVTFLQQQRDLWELQRIAIY